MLNTLLAVCLIFSFSLITTTAGACGRPYVQPSRSRIANGNEVKPHSWPWTIYLTSYVGSCGGSLIDPNGNGVQSDIVVTAAHCVGNADASRFTVLLGAHDNNKNEPNQIKMGASRVRRHESYTPGRNDIALLKLKAPVKFNQYIQPVCLPRAGQNPSDKQNCYAVGWGLTSPSSISSLLQQTRLPVLANDTCSPQSEAEVICAGLPTGSTCSGDSGGPLVCSEGGSWTLFGATSYGIGQCGSREKVTGFARISNYIDWIRRTARSM